MPKIKARKPIVGEAFDSHQMNDAGRLSSYARELRYYRPRGHARIANGLDKLASIIESNECEGDEADLIDVLIDEAESLLTEWAQRVTRNQYIHFGPFPDLGSVGFTYSVESAIEDCDIKLDAGDDVPRGFTGQAAFVTDHGNVAVRCYSRGRMTRELFDVV